VLLKASDFHTSKCCFPCIKDLKVVKSVLDFVNVVTTMIICQFQDIRGEE